MTWLFDNLWLKMLAVAIACVLWVVVSSERSERVLERTYDVPVVFSAIPQQLIVTKNDHDEVRVRLRGGESALGSMSSQTLEATIDLSDVKAGEVAAIIRPQALNIPSGIDVVSITPAKISFTTEQRRQKLVPIRPFTIGDPAPGMRVAALLAEPENALVSGPASVVRDMTEVVTERVVLAGRSKSFSVNVGVVSDRSLVRVVEPINARVDVALEEVPGGPELPAGVAGPAVSGNSTSPGESERIGAPREREHS